MADIKKLLEENENFLECNIDDTDSESELLTLCDSINTQDVSSTNNCLELKCSNAITLRKRNGEKRLPTRRPDPNVYNRNALLARENRRKKKVYLETIEKELQNARKANIALAKALKRQVKIAQRLEKEKEYLENLVAKRSDPLERFIPEISPLSMEEYTRKDITETCTKYVDGLCDADALSIDFDSPTNDLDSGSHTSLSTTSWDDIWGNKDYNVENPTQKFDNDHCYAAATLSSTESPEQSWELSVYVDVEENCQSSNWNHVSGTLPLQLLNENS